MGIRFTVFAPRPDLPSMPGLHQVLGDSVTLRPWAEPVLAGTLTLDEDGYGDVTDLPEFARRCHAQMAAVDQEGDQAADRYFYWSHLAELADVTLAFVANGVPAKLALS